MCYGYEYLDKLICQASSLLQTVHNSLVQHAHEDHECCGKSTADTQDVLSIRREVAEADGHEKYAQRKPFVAIEPNIAVEEVSLHHM